MTTTFKIEGGDVQFNVVGAAKTVSNGEKVRQDVAEMLAISVIEGFGASLIDLIGAVDQVDFLRGTIYRQILGGVNGLIRLQRGRQRSQRSNVELIDSVALLQVVVESGDPTGFAFKLDLQTVEGQVLTLSGTVFPTITQVVV